MSPPADDPREGPDSGAERNSLADLVDLLERERPLADSSPDEPDPSLWLESPGDEAAEPETHTDPETAPDADPDARDGDHADTDTDARKDPKAMPDAAEAPAVPTQRPSLADLATRVSRRTASSPRSAADRSGDRSGESAGEGEGTTRSDRPAVEDESAPQTRRLSRETALDLVGEEPNVLLLGPESCTADQHLCTELLAPAVDADVNLLLVTYDRSAADRAAAVVTDLATAPERTAIVSLGGSDRSGSTVSVPGTDVEIPVKSVSNPNDLMKLGFAITKYLSEWESSSARTLVCFHSLSDALRAADPRLVLRFLHVLHHQIAAAGAQAHYHLDPEAHPSELVLTFTPLFEAVLRFDRDGSVRLER